MEAEIEGLIRDHRDTKVSVKVRNLKHEIDQLEHTFRVNKDPIISREIQKRLNTKRRSLEAAERKAGDTLKKMTEKMLNEMFTKILEEAISDNN